MPADRLPELLDVALSAGADEIEVVEETIDFGELAGPGARAERSAFAELLAGTSDKTSRAYKAQRRNVERWVKGRRPITISVQRIVSARRQQSARLRRLRERGADVRLRVSWYATRKQETLPPQRWVHIPREATRSIVRSWAAGDLAGAARELRGQFLEQYEVPNPEDWLRDVIVADLFMEPGQ